MLRLSSPRLRLPAVSNGRHFFACALPTPAERAFSGRCRSRWGSRHIDYRISTYQPMAHVARHKHAVQEQIYHVL
jgi:hypothetical protein